jgi:hypothetical protein
MIILSRAPAVSLAHSNCVRIWTLDCVRIWTLEQHPVRRDRPWTITVRIKLL